MFNKWRSVVVDFFSGKENKKKSNDSASMSIILYLLFEEGGPKVGRTLTFGLILHARKARSP